MSDYISLKQLAQELGLDRSNMRKYVLSKGLSPLRVRTPESKGQLTLALTLEDADSIRDWRAKEGFCSNVPVENGDGFFYVIQLIPEFDPLRVKLGFTNNVDARLRSHRTAAPTAQVVKFWPCKRSWENAAIASITRLGCTLVANEVYSCADLNNLVERADAFFDLMP